MQIVGERASRGAFLQLDQGAGFELPNTLAADPELVAEVFQGTHIVVTEPETAAEDESFAIGEIRHRLFEQPAQRQLLRIFFRAVVVGGQQRLQRSLVVVTRRSVCRYEGEPVGHRLEPRPVDALSGRHVVTGEG